MSRSIRRRLQWILLSTITVIWLLMAFGSYRDVRHEVTELYDAQLAQAARTLLALSEHELDELRTEDDPGEHVHIISGNAEALTGHKYELKLAYQIWVHPEGGAPILMMRSQTAPAEPLSDKTRGYSDQTVGAQRWRVFALSNEAEGFSVQVAENYAVRGELVEYISLRLLSPLLIALPLLGVLMWYGIGRGLRPLVRLAEAVGRREADNLSPLDLKKAPEETRALVGALNNLFSRLERAFENERRFTADAAHELRTPLAALKTQAQVALRSTDEAERQRVLEQVIKGVDRASRMVAQLLTLARLDPEKGLNRRSPVNMCPLVTDIIADMVPVASRKSIDLYLAEPCAGVVSGDGESLMVLIRNLCENAVRYTPEGGSVEVSVTADERGTVLQVADSGPGIAPPQRERIFDRFYRGETAPGEGSGLGLSIVRRIVQLHGAAVELGDARLGGLAFQVRFPPTAGR